MPHAGRPEAMSSLAFQRWGYGDNNPSEAYWANSRLVLNRPLEFDVERDGPSWQTDGGSLWRQFADTSAVDPLDETLLNTYNYNGSARDDVSIAAVRHGFEPNYQGDFEWNLDLWAPGAGGAFVRPWLYTYTWATGVGRLTFKGLADFTQFADAVCLRVRPFADDQSAATFKISNAAGTVDYIWHNAEGFTITPTAAAKTGLIVIGAASQSDSLQEWQDSGANVMSKIASDGTFFYYGSSAYALNLYTSTLSTAGYGQIGTQSGNVIFLTWRLTGGTSPNFVFKPNNATMLTMDGINSLFTIADAMNVAVGTTTGTKIGTVGGASGQKLGFFGATPIVNPVLATGVSATVDNVITALQNLGLVRQS